MSGYVPALFSDPDHVSQIAASGVVRKLSDGRYFRLYPNRVETMSISGP